VPIASQQASHPRAGSDPRQQFVLFRRNHQLPQFRREPHRPDIVAMPGGDE
jgi:hypothetical protein